MRQTRTRFGDLSAYFSLLRFSEVVSFLSRKDIFREA